MNAAVVKIAPSCSDTAAGTSAHTSWGENNRDASTRSRRVRLDSRRAIRLQPPTDELRSRADRTAISGHIGNTKRFRGTLRNRESPDLRAESNAAGGDRTHDLRIKSPLLCQLSYGGVSAMIAYWGCESATGELWC